MTYPFSAQLKTSLRRQSSTPPGPFPLPAANSFCHCVVTALAILLLSASGIPFCGISTCTWRHMRLSYLSSLQARFLISLIPLDGQFIVKIIIIAQPCLSYLIKRKIDRILSDNITFRPPSTSSMLKRIASSI